MHQYRTYRFALSLLTTFLCVACQADDLQSKTPATLESAMSSEVKEAEIWRTVEIATLDEGLALLDELNYTLDNWRSGDHSVPRAYFTKIPKRWAENSKHMPVKQKKMVFLFLQAPLILRANELVLEQRAEVEIMQEALAMGSLSNTQLQRLNQLAESYGEAPFDAETLAANQLKPLLDRLDIVPLSLALSQAANESGWGTSRFASEGNALFGQWGWSDNVITPKKMRKELGNYGVMAFDSPMGSVTAYIHNINTHSAYERLRQDRAQMRKEGKVISGAKLAGTLDKYSERGEAYVKELRSMISYNNLEPTDTAYLRDMQAIVIVPVGDGV